MTFSRRGFLGLLTAAPIAIVAPELAELLAPKWTIFLPPVSGWKPYEFNKIQPYNLFTVEMIHKEALRVLEMSLNDCVVVARQYDESFLSGSQWGTINIKRPPRYDLKLSDRISIAGARRA